MITNSQTVYAVHGRGATKPVSPRTYHETNACSVLLFAIAEGTRREKTHIYLPR